MNTQQAYIEGFMKRASEYGYSYGEAVELYKQATAADAPNPSPMHTKPIVTPAPAPVRQFGMTSKNLTSAQNQLENSGQLNLAGG